MEENFKVSSKSVDSGTGRWNTQENYLNGKVKPKLIMDYRGAGLFT